MRLSASPSPIDTMELPSATIAVKNEAEQKQKIVLFVNPLSGGKAAAKFTEAGLNYAEMRVTRTQHCVQVWIWDVRDGPSGWKPGFLSLKEMVDDDNQRGSEQNIIVIVAGGDGTVMWCASELWAHGINTKRIVIGVVPYGTGNDFARVFRWNRLGVVRPFQRSLQSFQDLVAIWMSSKATTHDIWQIVINLHSDGVFRKVDGKTRKKVILTEKNASSGEDIPLRTKSFYLSNYFSIGVDARIGMGFDKNRSSTPSLNRMQYMFEGAKKLLFKKNRRLNGVVSHLLTGDDIIFITEAYIPESSARASFLTDQPLLLPTASLIFSNIPSFAGGCDLWNASHREGIVTHNSDPTATKLKSTCGNQKVGDAQLEILGVMHGMDLAVEQVIPGRCRRIHQGPGPFTVKLNATLPKKRRCYFQVDGEFFQMTRPDQISLSWHTNLNVLTYENETPGNACCGRLFG